MFLFNPILLLFHLLCDHSRIESVHCLRYGLVPCSVSFAVLLLGNWWGGWGWGAPSGASAAAGGTVAGGALGRDGDTSAWGIGFGNRGFLVQLLGSFVDFNDVLLTLFNAGAGDGIPAAVMEYRIIWNPLLSQLLHHSLFFFNLPVSRWDFLFVAAGEQMPLPFVLLLSLLWLSAASGLGYAVMKKSELQAELQAE